MDYLHVTVRHLEQDIPLIEVAGSAGHLSGDGLKLAIGSLMRQGHKDVIVSLSRVHHLDSSGLGVIMGALRCCRDHGGAIRIVCGMQGVRRIFELTAMDKLLDLYCTEEQALDAAMER
jgi:anti-sigma B factor antagonist